MIKKIAIFILFFYLLISFQTSFFPHFSNFLPNTVLIAIILINLFVPLHSWFGVSAAFVGGFFLDIFSENFFGFWILILLIMSIFIKFVFKKYVYPVIKLSAPLEKT